MLDSKVACLGVQCAPRSSISVVHLPLPGLEFDAHRFEMFCCGSQKDLMHTSLGGVVLLRQWNMKILSTERYFLLFSISHLPASIPFIA